MEIIKLENACKTFGANETAVRALINLNMVIEKGEMVAIIGPSGSGKSTLMNIIGCLDKLDSGSYKLRGNEVTNLKKSELAYLRNSEYGFVVQHFALIDNYTVYENVKLPLNYSNKKKKKGKKEILEVLDRLGIKNKKDNYPSELSGGQCQRVAIARGIINDPEIILADEPTGALDSKTGAQVMEMLKELNNNGKTIIIVTHDINIANNCKRIVKIEDGRIVEDTKWEKKANF